MRYTKLNAPAQRKAIEAIRSKVSPLVKRFKQSSKQMSELPHDSDSYVDAYYAMLGAQNELKLIVGKKMATSLMKGCHIDECAYECAASFTVEGELKYKG